MRQRRAGRPSSISTLGLVTLTVLVLLGLALPASAATFSYTSTPNRSIPDNDPAGVFDFIVSPDNGQIVDVNLELALGHPFVGDLVVTLQHDGQFTELWLQACGPQADMSAVFDDEGAPVVCTTPIAGVIDPATTTGGAGQLSAFDGLDVNGQWQIQVADVAQGNGNGFFQAWTLHVETAPPVPAPTARLYEPGCRQGDNPLYGSPCRGGGACAQYGESDFDFVRRLSSRGARDHMSRMSSRVSMRRNSDDDSSDDDSDDRARGADDHSMSMSYDFDLRGSDDESSMSMDAMCGAPVSSATGVFQFSGEYHRTDVDMYVPGRGLDVVWTRTYRSRTGPASSMGQNWSHGYDVRVLEIDDAPTEAQELVADTNDEKWEWKASADPAGDPGELRYCTLRSPDPTDFSGPATVILDPEQPDTETIDPDIPAPGQLFAYLILPKNGTRPGSIGRQSNGTLRQGVECGLSGPELLLADGTGRNDLFRLHSSGPPRWTAPEFLTEFARNPDGSLTLTYPDTGRWNFHPPVGLPEDGKLATSVDRNGNTLEFLYDTSGNLSTIIDTLGRPFTLAYGATGQLQSLTDFTGRQVTYDYYASGDPNGSAGDLKSVTTPAVTGTPHGNDFPSGKTTVYSYSTGFADEQLNHNLLTITDPRGQTFLVNEYSPTTDPLQLDYDRVLSQTVGDPGDRIDYVYIPVTPGPTNEFATIRVIENDRAGNVTEAFYDAENRGVIHRDLAGRAPNPDAPTDDATNRPVNPLRIDDPPQFEARWRYTGDGRVSELVAPNLSSVLVVYDELNPDRRSRANPLSVCRLPGPLGGDQPQLCETFEYDTAGPTSAGTNFCTRHVDARGAETLHVYDGAGNRLQTTHRVLSIVEEFEYNPFGQLTAYVHPPNESGHRRRDELIYHVAGPQTGYLQERRDDAGVLRLSTTFEYDARGNLVRRVDPQGGDSLYVYNQLDQVVSTRSREVQPGGGLRYETQTYYDANDNVVRVDVENRDENGLLAANSLLTMVSEYDILDNPVRVCRESGLFTGVVPGPPDQPSCGGLPQSEFIVVEFEYDDNRNPSLVRSGVATDGSQPDSERLTLYDERDLVFQEVLAPSSPTSSTTQYDYDANGNLRRVSQGLEGTPRDTLQLYDGYDRIVRSTDPLGNVSVRSYDANGNPASLRVEGELVDVVGDTSNVRLFETTYVYDPMDRRTLTSTAHFDGDTQVPLGDGQSTTDYDWNDIIRIVGVTDDNGNQTTVTYDTANRVGVVTDAASNELQLTYDANSNVIRHRSVERSTSGLPDEVFETTSVYDGLDRLVSTIDPVGNTTEWFYDSRSNVVVTLDGKNGTGASGNEVRHVYDSANRVLSTTRVLTSDGTGGGAPAGAITTSYGWDDSTRLTDLTDDAGNVTTYVYDAIDRRVRVELADGTLRTTTYDAHHNPISEVDPNGTRIDTTHDLLDRAVVRDVLRGPGVGGTTIETFDYDGLSRVVRADDDDTQLLRSHDSLSNVVRETLGGQTSEFFHDGMSNRVQTIYPGGRTTTSDYDSLNRLRIRSDGAIGIGQYDYIGPGLRMQQLVRGNGTSTSYEWDGVSNVPGDLGVKRLARVRHLGGPTGLLDDRVYRWDPLSNKTRAEDVTPGGPGTVHDYVYDSIYRLTRETRSVTGGPSAVTTYQFDGVGNRTNVVGGPDPGGYVLDPTSPVPADEQVNQYTSTPFDDRVYDENGNLAQSADPFGLPPIVYVYDYADRIVSRDDAGVQQTTSYEYDALGRRVSRVVSTPGSSSDTRYFYDGHRVIEEQDGATGSTGATYVYGVYIDEVLQMQSPFGEFYFHADDQYNTIALSDASGGVRERYAYEGYGAPLFFDSLGNPQARSFLGVPYLFTGRRYDDDSGLYWFRTRYLDPRAGRFTSRDSLGTWGDGGNMGNGSAYAGNNPASMVDPFGQAAYLKFDGVEGESRSRPGHGVSGSTRQRGATTLGDVVVVRELDKSSPKLHQPGGGRTGATRRSRGDTTLGDVVVVRELDKSSTKLHQPGGGQTGSTRRSRGDTTLGDVVVVRELDKSSPKLHQPGGGRTGATRQRGAAIHQPGGGKTGATRQRGAAIHQPGGGKTGATRRSDYPIQMGPIYVLQPASISGGGSGGPPAGGVCEPVCGPTNTLTCTCTHL